MAFIVAGARDTINLNLFWVGQNRWNIGLSNETHVKIAWLFFENKKITVDIPNINSDTTKKCSFRYQTINGGRIGTSTLTLFVKEIYKLRVEIAFFENDKAVTALPFRQSTPLQGMTLKAVETINLEVPEELEKDQIYNLVIRSFDVNTYSAHLEQEKKGGGLEAKDQHNKFSEKDPNFDLLSVDELRVRLEMALLGKEELETGLLEAASVKNEEKIESIHFYFPKKIKLIKNLFAALQKKDRKASEAFDGRI